MTEYSEKLLTSDSPELYFPPGFDIEEEHKRVNSAAETLQQLLSEECYVDSPSKYQDGSLFTKIIIGSDAQKDLHVEILLSAFGNLATVYGELPAAERDLVVSWLNKFGYAFVPIVALMEKYSGKQEIHRGKRWLDRYFCEWYQ